MAKMNFKKPKTFWTCLVLFVIGAVSTINTIQFIFPDFSALAIGVLLIGIGVIVAGYLWTLGTEKMGRDTCRYFNGVKIQ